QFDGIEDSKGFIAEVDNLATGDVDATLTPGGLFEIRGTGLKIAGDDEHLAEVGIFLEADDGSSRLQIDPTAIAVNEPKTLKAIAPDASALPVGSKWYVEVRTQASAKSASTLIKSVRIMKSDFTVTIL
ncbi:MAG: DUF4469 domain-containing protein, partial [Prevotellaceae bacterium]|nr:DUF4469 domain-containing protein [Prevotellaceae bacterium]